MDTAKLKDIKLKQTLISDAEKAQPRLRLLWKNANETQRKEILELTGAAESSIDRARRSGRVSAKIVVPMAAVCNVSPFYLIGMTDQTGPCDEDEINAFLEHFGYVKRVGAKGTKKIDKQTENVAAAKEMLMATIDDSQRAFMERMSVEDIIAMIRAMAVRAEYDDKYKQMLLYLKMLLLNI
ncbi:MAG: hypothetical protein FWD16_06785 [Clostridia bacterium]|nr:hypothetical protein [Clostridia bacterium]